MAMPEAELRSRAAVLAEAVLGHIAAVMAGSQPEREAGERELTALEERHGFCLALCSLVARREGDPRATVTLEQRIFAVVLLKNCVGRQWKRLRQSATPEGTWSGVSDAEKSFVRDIIVREACVEPSRRIALQLCVVAACIARSDFPSSWSNVFSILLATISTAKSEANLLCLRRALKLYLSLLKELSSRRLPAHRRQLESLAQEAVAGMHQLWTDTARELSESLAPQVRSDQARLEGVLQCAETFATCSKVLQIMMIYGWPQESFEAAAYPRRFLEDLRSSGIQDKLLELTQQALALGFDEPLAQRSAAHVGIDVLPLRVSLIKANRALFRTINEIQQLKSLAFLPLLPGFLEHAIAAFRYFVQARPSFINQCASSNTSFDEKLAVLCTNFISGVLDCREYKSDASVGDQRVITAQGDVHLAGNVQDIQAQANQMLFELFSGERLQSFLGSVLESLVLSPGEVEEWIENPEEYAVREEELTATLAFRPAAESLLTTMLDRFPEQAVPMLVRLVEGAEQQASGSVAAPGNAGMVSPPIARREAAFLAVGLCAYDLHGKFPFQDFLRGPVFTVLGSSSAGLEHDVLRRRSLWLIGCIASEIEKDLQPALYDFLIGLVESVNEQADLVVRMTAARSLQGMVDSWDFEIANFAPRCDRSVRALMQLSRSCETSAGRLIQVSALKSIVERVQGQIIESLESMLVPINELWQQAKGPEWSLWQMAVLELLSNVVEAIGTSASLAAEPRDASINQLARLLGPLISTCVDRRNSEEFVYLCEPAAAIWCAIIKSATKYTSELHALLGALPDVLRANESEMFSTVLEIVEAHTLFAADKVASDFGTSSILPIFDSFIQRDVIKVKDECRAVRTVELILRSRSEAALGVFGPLLRRVAEHCCSTPCPDESLSKLHVAYLSLVARAFYEFGAERAALHITGEGVQGQVMLVDAWIRHFGTIGSSPLNSLRSKLWVLVLCQQLAGVLTTDFNAFQSRFLLVLNIWADVHSTLGSESQLRAAQSQLFEAQGGDPKSHFAQRKRDLQLADGAFAADLVQVLRTTIQSCQTRLPDGAIAQLMQSEPSLQGLTRFLQ